MINNLEDNKEYNNFSLEHLENLVKNFMLAPKNPEKRTITLYTGDEGAANYLRHFFSEEEVQEWLKAPYDIPNLGLRVHEINKPYSMDAPKPTYIDLPEKN